MTGRVRDEEEGIWCRFIAFPNNQESDLIQSGGNDSAATRPLMLDWKTDG